MKTTKNTTRILRPRQHARCGFIAACLSTILAGFAHAQPIRDPSQLSGLAIWQDAGALSLSDSAKVSSWPSSGGLARGASQPNVALQPTFHTEAINGRPVVQFGGDAVN